ncbi:hypothetical protein OE88DRAFT_1738229 [Heliocybe sulcata]|uniref:Uncharacterized protein n=1 Tax=Heliocybe sulcata TaxID=5364 RepID=A0A5C3MV70_9AGAM|nr:hypothetical protein OE88DRAFT_1738229 [Heliocybe sulcata]
MSSKISSVDKKRPSAVVIKSKRRFANLWYTADMSSETHSEMPHDPQPSQSHMHHRKQDSFQLNFSQSGLALQFPRPPSSGASPTRSKMSRASTPSLSSCFSGETATTESSLSEIASQQDNHRAPSPARGDADCSLLALSEDESFLPSLSDDDDDGLELSGDEDIDDVLSWYTQELDGILALPSLSKNSTLQPFRRSTSNPLTNRHQHKDSVIDPTNPLQVKLRRTQ